MLLKQVLLFASALLAVSQSNASADVTFKYISAAEAAKLVTTSGATSKPYDIASDDAFRMSLQVRTQSSHVERHMGWNEEIVVQEGDVLLNYGGSGVNPRENSPGEFNGDSIAGGSSVMMHAGDIAIIPAGTWHEEVIQTPLMRYILFKTTKK